MIYTITLNTAVDLTLDVAAFTENSVVEASSVTTLPSGKGINVARVLRSLGDRVTAIGLVGQFSRGLFSTVREPGLRTAFVLVSGFTRHNLTIVQTRNGATTHIRSAGFRAERRAMLAVENLLRSRLRKGDFAVFSGSLPPGAPATSYRRLAAICRRIGSRVAIDASGSPLLASLAAKPSIVKLNRAEFISTFRLRNDLMDAEIPGIMAKLLKGGMSLLAVTFGSGGVLVLRSGDHAAVRGKLHFHAEYSGRKVVGSGDAMLAGLVHGTAIGMDYMDTIRLGVACGAANVIANRAHPLDRRLVRSLSGRVELESVPAA